MKFKFDPKQDYQLQAIDAVVDLFEGQPRYEAALEFKLAANIALAVVPNRLDLDDTSLLANLQSVQKRNRVAEDGDLQVIEGSIDSDDKNGEVRYPNFSVEMETGTGKTYVYLRSVLELYRRYGMSKFIVVVPSLAIREGVLKTLQITRKHLRRLYDNPVYRYYVYDSANLSQVKQFALSDSVEIMVMTIDSFRKAENVIHRATDRLQGETPIHLVQAARPVLILDEPQNMESEKSIAAITTLNPLFALRYSATHRRPYNLVYRLTPADAYRQGLVKKIEVASVVQEGELSQPYIRVEDVQSKKNKVSAKLAVRKLMAGGSVKEKIITVGPSDSLAEKTKRSEYDEYDVDEINPGGSFIRFANNVEMNVGDELGADKDDIFAAQIRYTVEEHFRKQARLASSGIKVLSLFFIDRVDNYADDDGIVRRLFNEAFDSLKVGYKEWKDAHPEEVQAAYFAKKRRKDGEDELLDSKTGEAERDGDAYDLIMKDKELLLGFPEASDGAEVRRKKKVSFIFSHSALREGWDNPNVFQICTLNQTASQIKKRQEVGRGVRLAVNQEGTRVKDETVNILTVVANESYKQYVETLQDEIAFEYRQAIEGLYGKSLADLSDAERREIEDQYGEGILPPPPRETGKNKAKLHKARVLSDEFEELWERIKHKTRYAVDIKTSELLGAVLPELEAIHVSPPRVTITKAQVKVGDTDIFEAMQLSAAKTATSLAGRYPLPNLLEIMTTQMEHTSPPVRLTRRTLLDVFRRTKNKKAALKNPHEWAAHAVRILKEKLADHLVSGIQYEKLDEWYEMKRVLSEKQVALFSKYIVEAPNNKAVYDLIPCDSQVEKKFVEDLEAREDVALYLKLPTWFTVPTPVGEYQPDWAVVMDNPEDGGEPILYLVTETKASTNPDELRSDEWRKIQCGAAHFGSKKLNKKGALEGVDYKVVTTAAEL